MSSPTDTKIEMFKGPQVASVHAFFNPNSLGEIKNRGHVYPCSIQRSRYSGNYSGVLWHCWPVDDTTYIPDEAYGQNDDCRAFWLSQRRTGVPMVGKGESPNECHQDLVDKLVEHGRILSNIHSKTPPEKIEGLNYFKENYSPMEHIDVHDLPQGWRKIDGRLVKKVNRVFANIHERNGKFKVRVGAAISSVNSESFDTVEEAVGRAEDQLEEHYIQ